MEVLTLVDVKNVYVSHRTAGSQRSLISTMSIREVWVLVRVGMLVILLQLFSIFSSSYFSLSVSHRTAKTHGKHHHHHRMMCSG